MPVGKKISSTGKITETSESAWRGAGTTLSLAAKKERGGEGVTNRGGKKEVRNVGLFNHVLLREKNVAGVPENKRASSLQSPKRERTREEKDRRDRS